MLISMRVNNKRRNSKRPLENQNSKIPVSAINLIGTIPDRLLDETFSTQYLKAEFMSKFNDSDPGSATARKSAAIAKWHSIEVENERFSALFAEIDPGYNILPRVSYSAFIKFARRLVSEVLGELSDTLVLGNFSGGSSTSRTRRTSEKSGKFVGLADITESAYAFVDVIHREAPLLKQCGSFYNLREVGGAILFTVPKNADIDRCACKEPDVNMFLQKGVGKHIRRRLLRFGQNLNDQSRNRDLARVGSLSGDLATIDLSSASDTVNTVVVKALLPEEWFLYLNDIRSHTVEVDGEIVRTSMFSSMGNGFTFELESLLFWALMKTTAYFEGISGTISVYGDDIIVPSFGYAEFTWILSRFGFKPNLKKSFATGPFRESCGGHYHLGEDVTPFYLRKPPKLLTDLIRVCNQLRRWATACPSRRFANTAIFPLWEELAAFVPKEFWGGHDCQVDTQLVSPTPSGSMLLRVSTKKRVDELGRYLSWHCDNWKRSSDDLLEGSYSAVDTTSVCRKRRANSAYGRVEEFYEELFPITVSG